jgi:hypothetical protein
MAIKNRLSRPTICRYETLYDVDIVVADDKVTLEQLNKQFKYSDGDDLSDDILGGGATTTPVIDRATGKCCSLIKFNDFGNKTKQEKALTIVEYITHESMHSALDIFAHIGENVDPFKSNEPLAYLVGYIAKCAYKTLNRI